MERKPAILIVDDDTGLTSNLQDILEAGGYSTAVAHDGQTALNLGDKKAFDLAIVDIRLPDMSGIELTEKLTELLLGTAYIIVITGYASLDTAIVAAGRNDIVAYLTKPLNMDHLVALIKQVTERKRVEEKLRQTAEEWRKTFDSITDLVSLQDKDFKLVRVNRAYADTFKMKPEELIGKTCYKIVHGTNEPWPNCPHKQTLEDRKPHMAEFFEPHLGVHLQLSTSPIFNEKDEVVGTVHIAKDISERKKVAEVLQESEERSRDLFEGTHDMIQSVALDGRFAFANRAWLETLGYTEAELPDLNLFNIIHPESLAHCQELFAKVMRGESVRNIEATFVTKDGRAIQVEGNAFVRRIGGKVVATHGIFRDISERKRAEKAQERLRQQLQTKVSELEAFSYGIAHDLRSPLLSIEGFSRMLRADIQNLKMEMVQEDIRLLESGVRKMQQLLNRTLEYSRAGYQVKRTKNVPFGKIVKEVITEFNGQMSSIGATVSLAETFPRVYVDRMRIRQVLTNLIQNSINYRDKTRPLTLEIGHRLSEDEVVFFVRDNGIGIDASETEKVFALFYRGTTDGEGSGAGLAIVKRIIEAHGGRIWVQDQSGKGTTMCFALPQQSGTNKGDNNGKD